MDPGDSSTIVWYVSGAGVCRPAVFHLDENAGVWVRGAPCDSVVDGGVFVQRSLSGRVEIRLLSLKFDGEEGGAWTINYRLI